MKARLGHEYSDGFLCWWSRQNPDSGRLVGQFGVGVDVERQPNIAVPGQSLGHLRSDAGTLEAGDEEVPTRMEVGKAAGVVGVGEEVRFFAFLFFGCDSASLSHASRATARSCCIILCVLRSIPPARAEMENNKSSGPSSGFVSNQA